MTATDRAIRLAIALTDSTWLYLAISFAGHVCQQGIAPLPWPVVVALLAGGGATVLATEALSPDPRLRAALQAAIGAAAVYAAVATARVAGEVTPDGAWLPNLFSREFGVLAAIGLIVASAGAVIAWRRSLAVVAAPRPDELLLRSFRWGAAILPVSLFFGLVPPGDPLIVILPTVFIAASMAGLAASRLSDGRLRRPAATSAVGAALATFLGAGGIAAVLAAAWGESGIRAASGTLAWAAGTVWHAILWVVLPVFEAIVSVLAWLLQAFHFPRPDRSAERPSWAGQVDWEALSRKMGGADALERFFDAMQVPAILLGVLLAYLLLAGAYRGVARGAPGRRGSFRQRLEGERDAITAVGWWLNALFPASLTRGLYGRNRPRLPAGPEGIVEALRLYYALLAQAAHRGFTHNPARTPAEQVPFLEGVLPHAPVAEITRSFVAACYGGVPTDMAILADLRARLATRSVGGTA